MEQQTVRHTGIITSFDLERPSWPVITPQAKGTVQSALNNIIYDLRGLDFIGMERLLPFVGVRISFTLFRWIGGKVTAGDIRFENSGLDA
ncbi:hypothetical protein [Pseudomonas umsongensis]|jgi:hypothetical protein|uniref:hypothetical protein n=1 Tax=Pseudomonas umsongensis TaxID=198618 RepID=UPI0015BE455C|nr:hypothetical protein [Pseudomonas umsongensis]NWL22485.1 hypothetical protein [Pseudomonas umsongensis]